MNSLPLNETRANPGLNDALSQVAQGEVHQSAPNLLSMVDVKPVASNDLTRDYLARVREDFVKLEALLANPAVWDTRGQHGTEIEFVMVDQGGKPAFAATKMLPDLKSGFPHLNFTGEVLLSNLEASLPCSPVESGFVSRIEHQLAAAYLAANQICQQQGLSALMIGILPTYTEEHDHNQGLASDRFIAMQNLLCPQGFPLSFDGKEPIDRHCSSIATEGFATSVQLHLSGSPEQVVRYYNLSMAFAGLLTAVAANSPVAFEQLGWEESRIGLLQNAATPDRYYLGKRWISEPIELFTDILGHAPLIPGDSILAKSSQAEDGSFDAFNLSAHNGAVWRWIRPCIGFDQGVPHLRVEFRPLPAGPTARDMAANAALYYGLMAGYEESAHELVSTIPFGAAEKNFYDCARDGLKAQVVWQDGEVLPAAQLLGELLPIAELGLQKLGVSEEEIVTYISVIRERLETGQTGARWQAEKLQEFEGQGMSRGEALEKVTLAYADMQARAVSDPDLQHVARWPRPGVATV